MTAVIVLLIALQAGAAPDGGTPARGKGLLLAGRVEVEDGYCGGARPSQEMMQELRHPAAGRRFAVLRGNEVSSQRPAAEFTTNGEGRFQVRLPYGTYCVVDAARASSKATRVDPKRVLTEEESCRLQEARRCDALWTVDSSSTAAWDFTIAGKRCAWSDPCSRAPVPVPP